MEGAYDFKLEMNKRKDTRIRYFEREKKGLQILSR